MKIDVVIPTKESESVIGQTIDQAAAAIDYADDISLNQLVVVDDESDDDTLEVVRHHANLQDWDTNVISKSATLPEARELGIGLVETEWFWFLDDDVRVRDDYISRQVDAIAPAVGAIQGRKEHRSEHPSDWVHRRSRRGGTHATLIRHEGVSDVEIPDELTVLEDEYLRRWIESRGYIWFFHSHARFEHYSQERHPIGWNEGYLGGKYGLQSFQTVALNVPYAVATDRNPLPHAKRMLGWLAGRRQRPAIDAIFSP
jgi:glycosyltransferase involved in cell wall biosynthesis